MLIACRASAQNASDNDKIKNQKKEVKKRRGHNRTTELKYLKLGIGEGLPVGSFGSMEATNMYAGHANSGINGFVACDYLIWMSNLGYCLKLNVYSNSLNTGALPGIAYVKAASNAPYRALCAMAGFLYNIPVDKKTSFQLKPEFGIAICTNPEISEDGVELKKPGLGIAPVVGFDAACTYLISSHFVGSVSLSYAYTKTNYNCDGNYPPTGSISSFNVQQPIAIVNLSFSFGWRYF